MPDSTDNERQARLRAEAARRWLEEAEEGRCELATGLRAAVTMLEQAIRWLYGEAS